MPNLIAKGCSLVMIYVSKIAKSNCMQDRQKKSIIQKNEGKNAHSARKTKNEKPYTTFTTSTKILKC
jgi:hypothetical protein